MNIALTTVGSLGDMVPFRVIADQLGRRGHAVTVYAPSDYRWVFERSPVMFRDAAGTFTVAGLDQAISEAVRAPTPAAQMRRFSHYFFFETEPEAYFQGCLSALDGADLVLCNIIDQLGQEAAIARGLPWVCIKSIPPNAPAALELQNRVLRDVDDELSAHLERLTGAARRRRVFRADSPLLNLVTASPSLIQLPAETDGPHRLTGAWLDPATNTPLPPEVAAFCDAGPPPVFVTLGSMRFAVGPTVLVDAVERAGARAIVQGDGVSSDRVLFCGPLSYPPVFRRVAGVVHHAGAGTTAEVCRAGLPSCGVPYMADQFYWAERLFRLGLGPPPIAGTAITVDALAARIARLREPVFGARVRAIAAAMAREDGPGVAVRLIEELAP